MHFLPQTSYNIGVLGHFHFGSVSLKSPSSHHDSSPFMSKLTASDLCKNKSLFHKSAGEEEIGVPENTGMEEIPESQARKYTPLNINLKGEDMWELEMALWNSPLSGLEIRPRPHPPGIWISSSAGGFRASAEHSARLKTFCCTKAALQPCWIFPSVGTSSQCDWIPCDSLPVMSDGAGWG